MSSTAVKKKVLGVYDQPERHWVGDGFHVRTLFSYQEDAQSLSPFLLLDYAGPTSFSPTADRRGVGEHPHRGFETVTIVYSGEVEHRDSSGGGGKIGPGDVQWMTAASGLVHEEFHAREFARRGGLFEMVQLWVNLPAKFKKTPPRYQGITASQIPEVELADGAGTVQVIAGEFLGVRGPAKTFTPIHVCNLRLDTDRPIDLALSDGYTTALVVLRGTIRVQGSEPIGEARLVVFDRAGDGIRIDEAEGATVLVFCGEPIDEPVVGYGPFVMNTSEEIEQAITDFNRGRFGRMQ